MVKNCKHDKNGIYQVIEKYLVSKWEDTGDVVDGKTVYRRKVVEKIKCPACQCIYLKGFFELEYFDE